MGASAATYLSCNKVSLPCLVPRIHEAELLRVSMKLKWVLLGIRQLLDWLTTPGLLRFDVKDKLHQPLPLL
jgi:hypothetical protein